MKSLVLGALSFLSACVGVTRADAPALLIDASDAAQGELAQVVAEMLDTTSVVLAKDAFSQQSVLFIERTPIRDSAGQRVSGRELQRAEQFQLIKSGSTCMVVQTRTGKRSPLKHARCQEE